MKYPAVFATNQEYNGINCREDLCNRILYPQLLRRLRRVDMSQPTNKKLWVRIASKTFINDIAITSGCLYDLVTDGKRYYRCQRENPDRVGLKALWCIWDFFRSREPVMWGDAWSANHTQYIDKENKARIQAIMVGLADDTERA